MYLDLIQKSKTYSSCQESERLGQVNDKSYKKVTKVTKVTSFADNICLASLNKNYPIEY
jgi:hypothetical protein